MMLRCLEEFHLSLKNKKIFAIAPSGLINQEKFHKALNYLKENENDVIFSDQVYEQFRNMAGNDTSRLEALLEALSSDINLVWAIRGGYGALRLLSKIPKNIKIPPYKILIGYSDITAYQLILYKYYGLKGISSHMIQVDLPLADNEESKHFISLIENDISKLQIKDVSILNEQKTEGIILGGCLSIISKMLGTDFLPSFKNKILFLEDVNEEHYKIDGYLAHLKNAGVFEDLNGIIFGKFRMNTDNSHYDIDLSDLITEYFSDYNYPVIWDLAFGHIKNMIAMPIGYYCILENRQLIFKKNGQK
jgi:muramoyltetrapeptide carboxypeptidase